MIVQLTRPAVTAAVRPAPTSATGVTGVTVLCRLLAAAATGAALAGLVIDGGPGRQVVESARGASVTLYGEGLYAADSWLVGAGNRGQDVVMLCVEVPVLLLVARWYRRGSLAGSVVLAGVLAFFAYFFTSMTFGTVQNRLFPVYVVGFGLSVLALARLLCAVDLRRVAETFPRHPSPQALTTYLGLVALALTAAWLPEMVTTSAGGHIADHVGPYTSSVTHALDLGLVVPVVVLAAVQVWRRTGLGCLLAPVVLVLNVCIGVLLIGQGAAQLAFDVPLTAGQVVGKMLSFAVLTFVAGGLLVRMAGAVRSSEKGEER